jgi:hypothetical protein
MLRKQYQNILKDLQTKMVLLAGPRQVGKTWLAKEICKEFQHTIYLNYDNSSDKKIIKKANWLEKTELIVFDELHKMPKWKNYLKGLYDTKPKHLHLLVTGSARLDIMRQVGDSLAGRYFMHHLLPFSPAELRDSQFVSDLDRFISRGGFPEPFLMDSDIDAQRWRQQYVDSLLRTDIFDLNNVQNLRAIQLVFELLRSRVGSPISYTSIAEDVGIAPNTVKKYIGLFEALFIVFRVTPYARNIARSLAKEPKIYFFDTGLVQGDDGAKFENLMALCLLKHVYGKIDYLGENWMLHCLRTKDGREVDFALAKDNKIVNILEAKISDGEPSKALIWFQEKYNFPAIQVVKELRLEHQVRNIAIRRASAFLQELDL